MIITKQMFEDLICIDCGEIDLAEECNAYNSCKEKIEKKGYTIEEELTTKDLQKEIDILKEKTERERLIIKSIEVMLDQKNTIATLKTLLCNNCIKKDCETCQKNNEFTQFQPKK